MKKEFILLFLLGIILAFGSCKEEAVNEITIYGNIVDQITGKALYNVLVQEANNVGGSGVTGNDGNYEITLPIGGASDGKFRLIASKDGYLKSAYTLSMKQVDKNRRVRVDFQLLKSTITYTGTVIDTKGRPIADVLIKETYQQFGSVFTDSDGKYTLALPPRKEYIKWEYYLTASKDGYFSVRYELKTTEEDIGTVKTVNFTLQRGKGEYYAAVICTVLDSKGVSIPDAQLTVYRDGDKTKGTFVANAMTDVNGECVFYLYCSYNYYFYVNKKGYTESVQTLNLNSNHRQEEVLMNFELTK